MKIWIIGLTVQNEMGGGDSKQRDRGLDVRRVYEHVVVHYCI